MSAQAEPEPPVASSSALQEPQTVAEAAESPVSTISRRPFAVYRPASASAPLPELPDSYFEPTLGELQRAHAGQVSKRERYEGPLLTRKLREDAASKEAAAKRARFPNTRIRVRFSDRTLLETAFPSTSQLPDVYAAIDEALTSEAKAAKFVLYQTPPKREFKAEDPKLRGQSLYDLQLAPSSVFYIRFLDEKLNANGIRPPLRDDLLERIEDLPAPPSFDEAALQRASRPKDEQSASNAEVTRTKTGTALPKWLKTGKSGHK